MESSFYRREDGVAIFKKKEDLIRTLERSFLFSEHPWVSFSPDEISKEKLDEILKVVEESGSLTSMTEDGSVYEKISKYGERDVIIVFENREPIKVYFSIIEKSQL